jgi:hypothetical protein
LLSAGLSAPLSQTYRPHQQLRLFTRAVFSFPYSTQANHGLLKAVLEVFYQQNLDAMKLAGSSSKALINARLTEKQFAQDEAESMKKNGA